MRLRARTDADVPVVERIVVEQRAGSGYPVSFPPEGVTGFVRRSNEVGAWVAELDGDVIGHVSLLRCAEPVGSWNQDEMAAYARGYGCEYSRLGIVSCLVVSESARGRGAGTALMAHATQACREAGLNPCLDVVHSHRDAVRLYRKLGWVTVAEIEPPWLPPGEGPVYAMILPPAPGAWRNEPAHQPEPPA